MSFIALPYKFSSATVPPPAKDEVRLDAGPPYTAVTTLWPRSLTAAGGDVRVVLLATPAGATLYLQDTNDSAHFGTFTTLAAAVDHTDYVAFPVAWVANGTALAHNQAVELAIVTEAVLPPTPPTPTLTLEEAKAHLRITDSDHDADVATKRDEAEAVIAEYLVDAAAIDPWLYRAAVKLTLAHLYENRGENQEPFDQAFWQAIGRLLRRQRTPALS